jgi:hypothetical protein
MCICKAQLTAEMSRKDVNFQNPEIGSVLEPDDNCDGFTKHSIEGTSANSEADPATGNILNLQEELYEMNNDSKLVSAQNCEEDDLIEGPELEQVQQTVGVCKDIIRNIIKLRGDVQPSDVSPYGFRVEYTEEGDMVVCIPDDKHPGEEWSFLLPLNDKDILAAKREFVAKFWWCHHQQILRKIENGELTLTEDEKLQIEEGKKDARRIERKYGKRNLVRDQYEFDLLMERLSALSQVTGAEQERSANI